MRVAAGTTYNRKVVALGASTNQKSVKKAGKLLSELEALEAKQHTM
jgi:hypothetical protein